MILRRVRLAVVTISAVISAVALAPAAYLAALTVRAGLVRRSRDVADSAGATRFSIYVPAHDEESIIASTVEALVRQRYPRDRFDVHVVADNCADATAQIATCGGAVVHVRDAPEDPGKGPALNWLHDRLADDRADVVVIIDADTIADPDFLAAMDEAFVAGARVAQGFYGVLDPETSPSVALRYAAISCRHHLRPLARTVIGGSSGLYGNGMAFRSELLSTHRWSGHLVEDAEFQMELLLAGHVVQYVPNARVAAEMPSSLDGARTQNERWELGRLQLARRFIPTLVRKATFGGALSRRAYADAAIDQALPPVSALAALDVTAVVCGGVAVSVRPSGASRFALTGAVLSCVALVAHVVLALRLVRAPASVYRALLSAPRVILWKIALLKDVVVRPDQVGWTRTTRNAEQEAARHE